MSSACSVNVPTGPRKPTRSGGRWDVGTCGQSVTSVQDSDVDEAALRRLLDDVRSGRRRPDDAVRRLRRLPYADLGFARVDHHRRSAQGVAEAVYGPGKTPDQCAAIVAELLRGGGGGRSC